MPEMTNMLAVMSARIATVAELAGRVQEAAELAELIRQKALPTAPVAAFVLPLGLVPRDQGSAGTGFFVQGIDERIGVLLVLQTPGDVTGRKALPRLNALVWEVIAAVAGEGTDADGAVGVFRFAGGRLVSLSAGLLYYQLDFAIHLQVRTI